MDKRLVIAHHPATLVLCRLCRVPNPPEQLSPGAICSSCWVREGAPRGWTLIPPGMALVPLQVVQQANVAAALAGELLPHCGERGVEEPVVLTLRRLLEERWRLLGAMPEHERCCYCGADTGEESDPPAQLVNLPWRDDLPDLFRCEDREACVKRINSQIMARHATADQRAN